MSKIILKKSSVASKVPLVGDLDYGELALNYTDGLLYYKDSGNVIQVLNPAAVGGGGGTTLYKGTATINFGSFPGSNEASVVVTGQTQIGSTPEIKVFVNGSDSTADKTADDHRYLPLFASFTAGAVVAGTGFTIYSRSTEKLQGTFKLTWEWSN
jgi:hypothetical protein